MSPLISALLSLLFIFLVLKIKTILIPPKNIRDIPQIPLAHALKVAINLKSTPELHEELKQRNVPQKEGFRIMWFLGNWVVAVVEPDYVKFILSNPDIFPKKSFANYGSALGKLVGRNVAIANGDEWKRLRKVINPAFKEKWDTNVFGNYANQVIQTWNQALAHPVNVHEWMQGITLDSLGDVGFRYKFNAVLKPNNEIVARYNSIMSQGFQPVYFMFPILDKLPRRWNYVKNVSEFRSLLLGVIEHRRQEIAMQKKSGKAVEVKDILGMLLQENAAEENPLTDQEVLENVFVFFLAGHDTTANALSVSLYFMAFYPEVQERVLNEVERVIGANKPLDYIPTPEDIKNFDYLSLVIKESMRIYPSATNLSFRECNQDVTIGKRTFPKGTYFSLSVINLHRNEKNFQEPNRFNPERFNKENNEMANPSAYLPFGGGSRICIGQTFSLTEQKVVLAMLVRNFSFALPPESPHRDELHFKKGGLLRPQDLRIQFEKRVLS